MNRQYLKMADVFPDNFNIDEVMVYNRKSRKFNNDTLEEYVLHALNSHDELVAEVERLCEFERDALRYRWLMQNTKLGIGRNGKDWDLQVDGSAPDAISEISAWIDNRMDGMM